MTTTETSTSVADETVAVVDAYLAAWNETDPARRAQRLAEAWTPEGHYRDPLLEAQGHDAIGAMAEQVHQQYPGTTFRRTTPVDAHHDVARFGWELAGPDAGVVVAGIDVASFGPVGRLGHVVGFFGDLAPADG